MLNFKTSRIFTFVYDLRQFSKETKTLIVTFLHTVCPKSLETPQ
jgi:hypothetical protein